MDGLGTWTGEFWDMWLRDFREAIVLGAALGANWGTDA